MKPLANPSESRKAGEALMVGIVLNNNTFNRISRDSPISFSKELIKKKKSTQQILKKIMYCWVSTIKLTSHNDLKENHEIPNFDIY